MSKTFFFCGEDSDEYYLHLIQLEDNKYNFKINIADCIEEYFNDVNKAYRYIFNKIECFYDHKNENDEIIKYLKEEYIKHGNIKHLLFNNLIISTFKEYINKDVLKALKNSNCNLYQSKQLLKESGKYSKYGNYSNYLFIVDKKIINILRDNKVNIFNKYKHIQ